MSDDAAQRDQLSLHVSKQSDTSVVAEARTVADSTFLARIAGFERFLGFVGLLERQRRAIEDMGADALDNRQQLIAALQRIHTNYFRRALD